MTDMEAIHILGDDLYVQHCDDPDEPIATALWIAVRALRERERKDVGCVFCLDEDWLSDIVCYVPNDAGGAKDIPVRHCPCCGRKIWEEGVIIHDLEGSN